MERKNNNLVYAIICAIITMFGGFIVYKMVIKIEERESIDTENQRKLSPYRLNSNSLEDFDLYFLKLENEEKNKVYSPLSIKYALEMLEEGATGETKRQLTDILGSYKGKKYINTKNMSLANGLFIKNTYINSIKNEYIQNLKNKYNAEVIYDSFSKPNNLNTWVSDRTFKMIDNLFDDIQNNDFILVNALAIDMEWVNTIQKVYNSDDYSHYNVEYLHEKYLREIFPLGVSDYAGIDFKNLDYKAKSVSIGASINKYDIVKELGENNIRNTISSEYAAWLNSEESMCDSERETDVNKYVDKFINELNSNYKRIDKSTDFEFYSDDSVKVFAKDLKEYNGTTLEYIGIMPKNNNLNDYIANISAKDINTLISKLKKVEYDNFEEGIITEIKGYIPMFKFDYELDLKNDLNQLGITKVFSKDAELSNISTSASSIDNVSHKANIEFSNEGIKAAAATSVGGLGNGYCGFEHAYEVPVEVIDLTFDNPYIFIIRDKDTGEVWFTGTVYEPVKYVSGWDF